MIVRLPLGRLNNHICDRLLLIMIVALHTAFSEDTDTCAAVPEHKGFAV
jgi:hypothetical protein